MRIYIMTDLEGVAGVLNFEDWCKPESRYHEMAREFLTREVNAAIEGFFAGGATHVLVADGHGHGAINPKLLDPRAELSRGWGPEPWPFGLDKTFNGLAWVGQHAKSGTPCAHLAHTGSFGVLDLSVNGVSIGEYGQLAMCASALGVPAIFAAGDEALTKEALALTPGIEVAAVKRGTIAGTGDECPADEYARRNLGAIHSSPERARQMIRNGAERAARRLQKEKFPLIKLEAPFARVTLFRPTKDTPQRARAREVHRSSVIALLNLPTKKYQE